MCDVLSYNEIVANVGCCISWKDQQFCFRVCRCQSVLIVCACSHPPVGEVVEALLHQDASQHVGLHHSQHGPPELIRAGQ